MAYNCDYNYCYPATYQFYPSTYGTQCSPQNLQQFYFNAYQNRMRHLQNREISMDYWIRQLQYFRNLLNSFAAQIRNPQDLKKLLETCNQTASKSHRTNGQCCCNDCLEKTFTRICNALNISCSNYSSQKCYCSGCQQNNCQPPPCSSYYNPYQEFCYYQPMPSPQNSGCCNSPHCNECRFKQIINKINYILSSSEQSKCGRCNPLAEKKSCCCIKEIKEETVTIKRENVVDNDGDKGGRKSVKSINTKRAQNGSMKKSSVTSIEVGDMPENSKKKQASIVIGEDYTSPSGGFEVSIQNQNQSNGSQNKKKKPSIGFQVDYTTYTKPK